MNHTYLEDLIKLIRTEADKGETQLVILLQSLLTPAEFEQIVKRVQIVKQLKQGKTHREIADDLGVGVATIARGARELEKGSFTYV